MGYIDSCIDYFPYEFLCVEEGSTRPPALPRRLRFCRAPKSATSAPLGTNRRASLKSAESSPPVFYRAGDVVIPDDAKMRKRKDSFDLTTLLLKPEHEGSAVVAQSPGRLVLRNKERFRWGSLENYKKMKRDRDELEANLTCRYSERVQSGIEIDIQTTRKLARHSAMKDIRQGWTPINPLSPENCEGGQIRQVGFAEEIDLIRADSGSSASSSELSQLATMSAQVPGDEYNLEDIFYKEGSRSPPRDRDALESSVTSRYNSAARHRVKDVEEVFMVTDETACEIDTKTRDTGRNNDCVLSCTGFQYGQTGVRKQKLEYLRPSDTSRDALLGASAKQGARNVQSFRADSQSEPSLGVSRIVIIPPSPGADEIPLKLSFTAWSAAGDVETHTASGTDDDESDTLLPLLLPTEKHVMI